LNPVQAWALSYWIYMDRRVALDDKTAELEHQCFNLFPERWGSLYRETMLPGIPGISAAEPEKPITDPTDLDAWFEGLNRTRTISGADAARFAAEPFGVGMATGTGRRV
jgi:hypothetical protein